MFVRVTQVNVFVISANGDSCSVRMIHRWNRVTMTLATMATMRVVGRQVHPQVLNTHTHTL